MSQRHLIQKISALSLIRLVRIYERLKTLVVPALTQMNQFMHQFAFKALRGLFGKL
ncbi:MAG: hypothetical protein ACI90S_000240 [Marinobacter psychrophilus]